MMSPGLLCPKLWSQMAGTSPSSATSSTQWPSLWRRTATTPEKTSCGAQRACRCMKAFRMALWWVWTTASSSFLFSFSWTSRRVLQVSVFAPWKRVFMGLKDARTWERGFKELNLADMRTLCQTKVIFKRKTVLKGLWVWKLNRVLKKYCRHIYESYYADCISAKIKSCLSRWCTCELVSA